MTNFRERLRSRLAWFLTHPVTGLATVFTLLSHAFGIVWLDALWMTLWTNAGTLFTALSVLKATFSGSGKVFGLIPIGYITAATWLVGGIFILHLLDKFWDHFQKRVNK